MTVQLIDFPGFIDDDEVGTGQPVKTATIKKMVHALNYLSYYNRRVFPSVQWDHLTNVNQFNFVVPVTARDYSSGNRALTVVLGVRPESTGGDALNVTITSSIASQNFTFGVSNGTARYFDIQQEIYTQYFTTQINIDSGINEIIDVNGSTGVVFDSWAAWEAPPIEGGTKSMLGDGITRQTASVTAAGAIDPNDYGISDYVDTDIADIWDDIPLSFNRHRQILFATSPGGTCTLGTVSGGIGIISVPTGGFFIPPVTQTLSSGSVFARVAIFAQNHSELRTAEWDVVSTSYASSSDTWTGVTKQWRPMGTPFDTGTAGVQIRIDPNGDWLRLRLYTGSASLPIPITVEQIIVWLDVQAIT